MKQHIKIIVIDDSAVVRQAFSEILEQSPDLQLIATAANPLIAQRKMQKQWPDLIILDIEMPEMDGLSFLRRIMAERPTPVVMCSSLLGSNSRINAQVFSAGALDIISKPKTSVGAFLHDSRQQLLDTLRAAAQADLKRLKRNHKLLNSPNSPQTYNITDREPLLNVAPKLSVDALLPQRQPIKHNNNTPHIIAMGASTGGTLALEIILKQLPKTTPGIVIVQHMSEGFTSAFADRLNQLCILDVKEAEHLDQVNAGTVLIAPGHQHMMLQYKQGKYIVELKPGPLINRHRPSVDVLFRSVSQVMGNTATGVLMTGMGDDGAKGLLDMHNAGAQTIAQDESSSVVFGMPKAAIQLRAVDKILALEQIPAALLNIS